MGFFHKIAQWKAYQKGISHCTFNPEGPGVVRIHLVPPKFSLFRSDSYIVILNGYYLLPIGYAWALLLSYFMQEVNRFDGKPIREEDEKSILRKTVSAVRSVYPSIPKEEVEEDLFEILEVLFTVAAGKDPQQEIEKLSLRAYGSRMTAPHRMDLMVSAMTDEKGRWQCNQKCTFCYAAGQRLSGRKELSTQKWMRILDRLEAARVPMVTFTGGEPTLREDLPLLIGHAKRLVTRLNTNGVMLTPELVSRLKDAGLDSLQVTLYSHDAAIHNDLVGSFHFSDTVTGIRNALQAGLDVSVNTPLCQKNRDYEKTLAFVRDLGVRFVTASGLICTGMAGACHEDYDLSEDALFAILKEAKSYCDEQEMEIDFTSPGLVSGEKLESIGMKVPMCGAALSNMAVAPDGTVIPCQSWLSENAGLGNILEDKFSRIWNHKTCLALRRMTEEEAENCPFRLRKEGRLP